MKHTIIYKYTPVFTDEQELRKRNYDTVREYMSLTDKERFTSRASLFAPDAVSSFPTGTAQPEPLPGDVADCTGFVTWGFHNSIIFQCANPNYFLVEADGWGIYNEGKDDAWYHKDHFIHEFEMKNGKIYRYRECLSVSGLVLDMARGGAVSPLKLPAVEISAPFITTGSVYEPYRAVPEDNALLASKNTDTVLKYMSLSGQARTERWRLFTDEGSTGPVWSPDKKAYRARGIQAIRQYDGLCCEIFPDLELSQINIFRCPDPNYILAEADVSGSCLLCPEKPITISQRVRYTFVLENGRISRLRNFLDPAEILQKLGVELPIDELP